MTDSIDREELAHMLRSAANEIADNQDELSRLDSFGGDGDHGTTMVRAMVRLEQALDENADASLGDLLQAVGWAIMGVDGGATGPLFGSLFMSMAPAVSGETLDAAGLAAAFEAGLAGVRTNTRAKEGDKTMIDALVPAVRALREAAAGGADISGCLESAAQAAANGARSTSEMQARFGRAKNLGEKSVGHQDPGATSVALIFSGLRNGGPTDA